MSTRSLKTLRMTIFGRWAMATLVAWLVFVIIILSKFSEEALPAAYIGRPLIIAAVVAGLIGLVSLVGRRFSAPIGGALAFLVALANPLVILIVLAALLVDRLMAMRGRTVRLDATEATLIPIGLLVAFTLVRAASAVDLVEFAVTPLTESGPRIVVVLLDGHPRADTLATLGIDDAAFEAELAIRGFDQYPSATSVYTYTNKTLLAMLDGAEVEDGAGSILEKRAIRQQLAVPTGYLVISPPVGHVTFNGGPRVDPNVVNDFESHLLGQSIVGQLATGWAGSLLMDGLRQNENQALAAIASANARRVFAHLIIPHPPFLYAADGTPQGAPGCWPNSCHIFDSTIEHLGISVDEWGSGMGGQIAQLDDRILTLVDDLVDADPDTVIVLFSDHGGRYTTGEPDEWHHSFLVARTPGHPNLFGDAAGPEDIFRILDEAYGGQP